MWLMFMRAPISKGWNRKRVNIPALVIESPEKRTFTHPSRNGQGQEAPAMAWHDFNNKRIPGYRSG